MKTRAVDDQTNRHRTNASALWQLLVQVALLFSLVSVGYGDDDSPASGFQKITLIVVPGSSRTQAQAINSKGQIVGSYLDSAHNSHGFLRMADGTITSFDAPGAFGVTSPSAINSEGQIVGRTKFSGFLRNEDGTFTVIAVPGASLTRPNAINSEGQVVGSYLAPGGATNGAFSLSTDE